MPWIVPLAIAGYSAYSAAHAASQRKKAEADLEKQVNEHKPNASILDYYNKALSRYSANPENSSLYNSQKQNIERGTAMNIAGLQDRRSGLAGLGGAVQNQNDALLRASAAAEGQQGQQLSQLGNAASAKSREDNAQFEMRYNLTAAKAAGQAQVQNSNTQNAVSNLGNAASIYFSSRNGGSGNGDGSGYNWWKKSNRMDFNNAMSNYN